MNRPVGQATLEQARAVVREPRGMMVLTTPVSAPGHDGYDCQYRAHVYEWSRAELDEGLTAAGWRVEATWGLHATLTDLKRAAAGRGMGALVRLPRPVRANPVATSVLAPAFPQVAHELALLVRPV